LSIIFHKKNQTIKPFAICEVIYTNQLKILRPNSDKEILEILNQPSQYEKGFRILMQKYQEPIYWHIRRMVKNHEDANDVVQNTFIKVYKGISKFKQDSKLYTWLYRIATNETITFINKNKKQKGTSIDDENGIENKLIAEEYSDSDRIVFRLKKAIDLLPEKQKLVFNMRYYDEMTYKQISEILDTSVGGLKASYHHAVKKIEQYFVANEQP